MANKKKVSYLAYLFGSIFLRLLIWPFAGLYYLLPLKWGQSMLAFLAGIVAMIVKKTAVRHDIENNLARVYGRDKLKYEGLAETYISKVSRYLLEVAAMGSMSQRKVSKLVHFHNSTVLKEALAQRKGVIIPIIHAGDFELLGRAIAFYHKNIFAVAKTPPGSVLQHYIDRNRQKAGMKIINVLKDNMFLRGIKALKNGAILLVMADTGATESTHHQSVEFMGRKVLLATGWAKMAVKAGCMIMPAFIYSDSPYQHGLVFGEALKAGQSEEELIASILPWFERLIKTHPTEWLFPLDKYQTKKVFTNM